VKEIKEQKGEKQELDVLVAQRFFDPSDAYLYDEEDPSLKTLKKVDEFLVGKLYASRVSITNSSDCTFQLKVITEIPQGALPV
jgi:hypothetical protein